VASKKNGTSLVGLLLQLLHDGKKTVVLVPKTIIFFYQIIVPWTLLLLWLDLDSEVPFFEIEPGSDDPLHVCDAEARQVNVCIIWSANVFDLSHRTSERVIYLRFSSGQAP
jgi:hypothetical protein